MIAELHHTESEDQNPRFLCDGDVYFVILE